MSDAWRRIDVSLVLLRTTVEVACHRPISVGVVMLTPIAAGRVVAGGVIVCHWPATLKH